METVPDFWVTSSCFGWSASLARYGLDVPIFGRLCDKSSPADGYPKFSVNASNSLSTANNDLSVLRNLSRMKPADINNNSNNSSINTMIFGCISADSNKRENKPASSDRIMSYLLKVLWPATQCIGNSTIYWPPARRAYDSERITVFFAAILLVNPMKWWNIPIVSEAN